MGAFDVAKAAVRGAVTQPVISTSVAPRTLTLAGRLGEKTPFGGEVRRACLHPS